MKTKPKPPTPCQKKGAYAWDLGLVCFGKKEQPRMVKEIKKEE